MIEWDLIYNKIPNSDLQAFAAKRHDRDRRRLVYIEPTSETKRFALEEILTNIVGRKVRWLDLNMVFMATVTPSQLRRVIRCLFVDSVLSNVRRFRF